MVRQGTRCGQANHEVQPGKACGIGHMKRYGQAKLCKAQGKLPRRDQDTCKGKSRSACPSNGGVP